MPESTGSDELQRHASAPIAMKIFAATFATETNTFAVVPTGRVDFDAYGIYRGDGSIKSPDGMGAFHAELCRLAAPDGHSVAESLVTFAQPSGTTLRAVYEEFRQDILDDLKAALPVGAVQLYLHGAMVADGYDDCEGDLIQHVRRIVGPDVPIGVELDLHCHFTEAMRTAADIIICYKEYPHTDGIDRLRELYRLTMQQAAGKLRPVTAMHDCRMVGLWHTTAEPMKSFVRRMQSFEGRDGVLSVSLGHGFPWGDTPDTGARLWVVADGDLAKATALAAQLGREFRDLRHQTYTAPLSIADAVAKALAAKSGPVVLADVGDNAGGGAMSDSTFILRALLDAGARDAVLGCYWDLGAVALCRSAGVGATLDLRIGGKCGPLSGDPVDLRVTVRAILDDHGQHALSLRYLLGTCVWVQAANGIDLVLNTTRSQVFTPEAFEPLGIRLADKKIIVVKSSQHFHAGFAPIAKDIIYVGSPGSTAQDFARIPFRKRSLDYGPRIENPGA
jgi:microcystin degradation protein MlrC